MRTVEVGTRYTTRVTFRLAPVPPATVGLPADPSTVTLRVRTPVGGVTTHVFGVGGSPIVKDSTGNYHAEVDATAEGLWWVRLEGSGGGPIATSEEGFWVTAAYGVADGPNYGVTVDQVLAYLPHHSEIPGPHLTPAEIEIFIGYAAARVSARIGTGLAVLAAATDTEAAARLEEFRRGAASIVTIGAASITEGASFPERAPPDITTDWTNQLSDRFEAGLADLATSVSSYLEARAATLSPTTVRPLRPWYSFPDAHVREDVQL